MELDVSSVDGGTFAVQSTGDSITVELRSVQSSEPVVIWTIPQLYGTIDAASTRWSVSKNNKQMTVRLKKLDTSAAWPQLAPFSQDSAAEEELAHPATENPLEERQHVRALLTAAQTGDLEGFEAAAGRFSAGDLSSVRDGNGRNALHFAAAGGHATLCHSLINCWGVNVDAYDEAGKIMDTCMLQCHCLEAVGHLTEHWYPQARQLWRWRQGLVMLAVCACCWRLVQAFPCRKAMPHSQYTALPHQVPHTKVLFQSWCAQSYQTGVVLVVRPSRCLHAGVVASLELLVEEGADMNGSSRQGTPLLWAIGSSQGACAMFLLEHGADANATDTSHISPVLLAAATGLPTTLPTQYCSAAKWKRRLLRRPAPNTPAPSKIWLIPVGNEELIGELITRGANVNIAVDKGPAPLHVAVDAGSVNIVKILLKVSPVLAPW